MKTLIKIKAIALIVGYLCMNSISAQPPQGHKPPPIPNSEQIDNMLDEMQVTLSLTESQKKEISTMYTDHFKELKVLIEEQKQQREQAKKEHDKLRNELDTQVKSILNQNQKNEYDDFVKAHKPKSKPQKK